MKYLKNKWRAGSRALLIGSLLTLVGQAAWAAGPHSKANPHANLSPKQHIQVAVRHYDEGRTDEAFIALSQALTQHTQSDTLYAVRGSLYLQEKRYADALSDLNKAAELSPNHVNVLVNRAKVYEAFGEINKSLTDLNTALTLQPDLVAARYNRGVIYYSSGDFTRALADFDQCIAIDPHLAGPYFNRASTKQQLGDVTGAIADLERFQQISPEGKWNDTAKDLIKRWTAESSVSPKISEPKKSTTNQPKHQG